MASERKSFTRDKAIEMWTAVKTTSNVAFEKLQPQQTEQTVFGYAPSLDEMRNSNLSTGGKKILFRGAFFWYHFRRIYFFIAPVVVVLGLVLALTLWNTVEGHLLIGSLISMFSCICVVSSYIMIIPWRKHPSTIVYNRAFVNIFFSFNIICETINHHLYPDSTCRGFAVITQFLLLAGELWLTCVALDLVFSLTNPFTSYRGNMRFYHFVVWGLTSFLAFVLMVDTPCQDRFEGGLCWVRIRSPTDSCIWGFYLFWILCMYMYQFGAIVFAFMRLRKGLPITFEIRSKIAAATFQLLFAYGIYLLLVMIFFLVVASLPPEPAGTPTGNFALVFLYSIAIRGFVDAWVWFRQHDFARPSSPNDVTKTLSETEAPSGMAKMVEEARKLESGGVHQVTIEEEEDDQNSSVEEHRMMRKRTSSMQSDVSTPGSKSRRQSLVDMTSKITGAISDGLKDVAEATIKTEFDETDLSPQVNIALRQQIVKYVTMGVMKAASLQIASGLIAEGDEGTYSNNIIVDSFRKAVKSAKKIPDLFRKKDPVLDNMQVTEFLLEGEHPFKAFAPDVFQKLRFLEGIDDQSYLTALQTTEKEQLSEGASGAFMFFCGGGDLIVKTIKKGESDVLHRSLPSLLEYLEENPKSLLVRFLGSYSLGVYAQTFYFVVMRNIFEPGTDVNERYDIKGSWVNRSASPAVPNKKVVCRHCNEMFIPVNKEKCSQIVGYHEANVVLKDNDLRTKISLRPKDAFPVLEIIKKDSDLLAELGVMDYSLIVGVKTCKFRISLDGEQQNRKDDSDEEIGPSDKQIESSSNAIERSPGTPGRGLVKVKHYATFRANSVSGPAIYYMGIVDFLQNWTTRKKFERALKIYALGQESEGTSVMHPDPYRDRFQNKMDEIFDLESLESQRRNKLKGGVLGKRSVPDKKVLSGQAIAPAGTTLVKAKKSDEEAARKAPKKDLNVSFGSNVSYEAEVLPTTRRPFETLSTPPPSSSKLSNGSEDSPGEGMNPLHNRSAASNTKSEPVVPLLPPPPAPPADSVLGLPQAPPPPVPSIPPTEAKSDDATMNAKQRKREEQKRKKKEELIAKGILKEIPDVDI